MERVCAFVFCYLARAAVLCVHCPRANRGRQTWMGPATKVDMHAYGKVGADKRGHGRVCSSANTLQNSSCCFLDEKSFLKW